MHGGGEKAADVRSAHICAAGGKVRDFAGQNRAACLYARELPAAIPVACF
jgi:hypothetical protein